MADGEFSRYFLYFFAKRQVPVNTFQPILQIVGGRDTRNGTRCKVYDSFFVSSACYIHDPAVLAKLPNLRHSTPKVRILAYEEGASDRPVMIIQDVEVLDEFATTQGLDLTFAIGDNTDGYDEYMTGKVFDPLGYGIEDVDIKPPVKRPRIAPNQAVVATARPNPPPAVNQHRQSPPKRDVVPVRKAAPLQVKNVMTQARGEQNVTPLNLITPFVNKYRILGLCIQKEIRDVNSAKGPMRVMHFTLADENGKTILITGWNELADSTNALVIENQMYYVAGDQGTVKKKNARFNFTDCDYEITLTAKCQVVVCTDQTFEAPKFSIKRKLISQITGADETFDIVVIVEKVEDISKVVVKTRGEEVSKRNVVLIDESCASINLTLWDEKANNFVANQGDVIAFKNVRIKEFNGSLSLNLINASKLVINPELPELETLYRWYENERGTSEIKSLSTAGANINFVAELRALGCIKNCSMIDAVPHGIYFSGIVLINEVRKDNPSYVACEHCNKKVSTSDHVIRCDKCGIANPPTKMRYMLNVNISDFTDTAYVTLFDEQATNLLGIDAESLEKYRQEDNAEFERYFLEVQFKFYSVRMQAKYDYYNDQKRLKFSVYSLKPVPNAQYSVALDRVLAQLENF